jgi:microcystin-dependent protein
LSADSNPDDTAGFPFGSIVLFSGPDLRRLPEGWLLCDGSLLNKNDFPDLFNSIQYANGGDDKAGLFRLPNLVNQYLRGVTISSGGQQTKDMEALERVAPQPNHAVPGNSGRLPGSVQGWATGKPRSNVSVAAVSLVPFVVMNNESSRCSLHEVLNNLPRIAHV